MALASCEKKATEPDKAPEAAKPAPGETPDEAEPPVHTSPGPEVKKQHVAPREAPPAKAPREAEPQRVANEHGVLTVSDIIVKGGESAAASIELVPSGDWKLNTEYPVRITLSGTTLATPALSQLTSKDPKHGVQLTSGGLRADVAYRGDALGQDTATVQVKFGVCSQSACLTPKLEARFQVQIVAQ